MNFGQHHVAGPQLILFGPKQGFFMDTTKNNENAEWENEGVWETVLVAAGCFPGEQFGENRDKQLTTGRDNPTRFLSFIFFSINCCSNSTVLTICINTELKERKLRIAFQHYVRWITVCCKGAQSTGLCFDTTTKRPSWWIWFLWDQMKSAVILEFRKEELLGLTTMGCPDLSSDQPTTKSQG